ncbi:VOC family protein [Streptomyces albidus (ex Kaewkla and Franco 2022)]|uniref:VOC family protein n=1 Tax=Streptomyces albidus (ex Kaewkla and Franco 2022) TaxID=722709 RepID=UPI0015EEA9C8|nr:VOC family protein [Streptomyces albidus (ex Kaewkla and Franco 2022)]
MTESTARQPHARHTPGTPCWASLLVYELAGSQEFYHELFGWEFYSGPQHLGPYVRAMVDGQEVAGLGEIAPGRRLSASWLPYMATDDADATADLIRERGGTVAVGPLDADEAGRMAIAADTTGATFGVWQTAPQTDNLTPAPAGVPGTPVWYELVTRDSSTAGHFYPAVFGYESLAEPGAEAGADAGFDYLTLHLQGKPVAGIHGVGRELPRDRGPHWKTYFAVDDPDATIRLVNGLGGTVVHEPDDSPYGRVATAADPEGAQFSVIAPV